MYFFKVKKIQINMMKNRHLAVIERIKKVTVVLILLAFSGFAKAEKVESILILDTFKNPVDVRKSHYTGGNLVHLQVDGARLVKKYLSEGMTENENDARQVVDGRLRGREQEITTLVMDSVKAVRLIELLDVLYVPAIVINKEYVVYGETDLNRAIRIWEKRK